jgi:hypothetical protein
VLRSSRSSRERRRDVWNGGGRHEEEWVHDGGSEAGGGKRQEARLSRMLRFLLLTQPQTHAASNSMGKK